MTTVAPKLPSVRRPNGKYYQPRSLRRVLLDNDGYRPLKVIVLGTHDLDVAEAHARPVMLALGDEVRWRSQGAGWWRESIRHGEPYWVPDNVRGAAGVMFTEVP